VSDTSRVAMTASLVTAAQRGSFGEPRDSQPMAGARFAAAMRLSGDLFAGAAVDGITTPEPHASDHTVYSHLGVLVALGAPYSHDWVGASVEGGVSLSTPGAPSSVSVSAPGGAPSSGDGSPPGRVAAVPYAKGTVVVQWPRDRGIRPYLALSYLTSRDAMNSALVADLGVAWAAW
jgi:hypothetical protein